MFCWEDLCYVMTMSIANSEQMFDVYKQNPVHKNLRSLYGLPWESFWSISRPVTVVIVVGIWYNRLLSDRAGVISAERNQCLEQCNHVWNSD